MTYGIISHCLGKSVAQMCESFLLYGLGFQCLAGFKTGMLLSAVGIALLSPVFVPFYLFLKILNLPNFRCQEGHVKASLPPF